MRKPFNPYLRRHSSLSEKARIVNEYTLRHHAGWTKNSDMTEIYMHELGGESSEDLLLAYGFDVRKSNILLQMTKGKKYYHHYSQKHAHIAVSQTSQPQNSASQLPDGVNI